ncbi:maleylpyruvate isomerase N-terminal domain-containing protein [Devosia nitrariae]|uniref:Maleylpyruvate isomerase n=1 Tax=Devosia nitrariae TaxID=2071872 RepID=A0ABQ5W726_9HYPH|nr:maleylpyruvate isomerase N-terminal domain-containing protein [Devosia nitrariae]GLQ55586.1 maleylpyruvate isomerase [Devosia nitrariae]
MQAVSQEEGAREALRERLGVGARYDAAAAPARELGWARRGTAYFARKLNELRDEALDGASLIPGWSRRHVVALIGYQARWQALAIEQLRTGEAVALPDQAEQAGQIVLAATLPARALRNLFDHAEVHLNVEWRDLSNSLWERSVRDIDGGSVAVRATPWIRARALWVHAVDLDNGGAYLDFPLGVLDALVADIVGHWQSAGTVPDLLLQPTDRPEPVRLGAGTTAVNGRMADLVRWLAGRGARRLEHSAPELPALPAGPYLVGRHSRLTSLI